MTYKIISTRQLDETIFTEVEYSLNDKETIIIEIPHFRPESLDDIEMSIKNRLNSELNKIEAIDKVVSLIEKIELNKEVNIK